MKEQYLMQYRDQSCLQCNPGDPERFGKLGLKSNQNTSNDNSILWQKIIAGHPVSSTLAILLPLTQSVPVSSSFLSENISACWCELHQSSTLRHWHQIASSGVLCSHYMPSFIMQLVLWPSGSSWVLLNQQSLQASPSSPLCGTLHENMSLATAFGSQAMLQQVSLVPWSHMAFFISVEHSHSGRSVIPSLWFPAWYNQMLFLIFGLATIAWSVVLWFYLPDSPSTASFLTPKERELASLRPKKFQHTTQTKKYNFSQLQETLLDPQAWWFLIFVFVICIPNGGTTSVSLFRSPFHL